MQEFEDGMTAKLGSLCPKREILKITYDNLIEAHKALDADGDGAVSASELSKAVKKVSKRLL